MGRRAMVIDGGPIRRVSRQSGPKPAIFTNRRLCATGGVPGNTGFIPIGG